MADGKKVTEPESTLSKLVEWFEEYEDATVTPRKDAERDRDFYDGIQWTAEELTELARRNQPAVTINRIAPKVNFVLGTEVRSRIDPTAYPRTPKHEDDAIIATDALRYVADREKFDAIRSMVTENLLIEGVGAVVITVEKVVRDGKEQVEIRYTHAPWDRVFYDPHSRKHDFSDAKYKGTMVWRDVEDIVADYDGVEKDDLSREIASSSEIGDTTEDRPRRWYDSKRRRARVIEHYWEEGGQWWYAHHTKDRFLKGPMKVVFEDEDGNNYCPCLLVSAHTNRENYRYGIVRSMVSPQEEINKRRSKALYLLTHRQVHAEEGAVIDPQEAQQELAKPDGWVELAPGALRDGTFQVGQTIDLAQGQMQLLAEAKQEIDNIGPHAALVAADQRQMSGRAFLARQDAGSMELEPVFDHLRQWQLAVFRITWNLIRQFWTSERWFRVRDENERSGHRFVAINEKISKGERIADLVGHGTPLEQAVTDVLGVPGANILQQEQQKLVAVAQQRGQPMPPDQTQAVLLQAVANAAPAQEPFTRNDISRLDVDIVLDVTPDVAIIQHEEFEMLAKMRQSGVNIPDSVIIESSALRDKRKLLSMLNAGPSPEQQQQMQMQMQSMQAQIQKLQADAQRAAAQAQKFMVEAQMGVPAEAEKDKAAAMKSAAEAGEKTAGAPMGGASGGSMPQ